MKKNDYAIYILIVYLLLIGILLLASCSVVDRTIGKVFPNKKYVCPTNDSKFFFRQAGTRPTKQYLKNNRR